MKSIILFLSILLAGQVNAQITAVNYIQRGSFAEIVVNGKTKGLISVTGSIFTITPSDDSTYATISIGESSAPTSQLSNIVQQIKCLVTGISINSIACTSYADLKSKLATAFPYPSGGSGGGGTGDASAANQTTEIARLTTISNAVTNAASPINVTVSNPTLPDSSKTRYIHGSLQPAGAVYQVAQTGTWNINATVTGQSAPFSSTQINALDAVTGTAPVAALSQTAVVNNVLMSPSGSGWTDVSGFASYTIQVNSLASSGTYIIEASNDGINPIVMPFYSAAGGTHTPLFAAVTATVSNIMYAGNITFKYLRLRIVTTLNNTGITVTPYYNRYAMAAITQVVENPTPARLTGVMDQGAKHASSIWEIAPSTTTTNGSTTYFSSTLATTNAQFIKASAGMLWSVSVTNASAAVKYFRFFNKASAPTVGTDLPVFTIAVPATSTVTIPFPVGLKFSTGIAMATTTGAAYLASDAIALGDLYYTINYQ